MTYSFGFDPPEEENNIPRCPVCGEETYDFYEGLNGEIVGCEHCVSLRSAHLYEEVLV